MQSTAKVANPEWVSFLNGFKSKKKYENVLADYLTFHDKRPGSTGMELSMRSSLPRYVDAKYAEVLENGQKRYKASTIRSWYSVLKRFWELVHHKDLKEVLPAIEINLSKWEKSMAPVKKAKTFETGELLR